ncbi:MAG TPA: hypothetical protein VE465_20695 [Streptosporangiaceae bacterium]|nr:hypothetical protein [Streptosporangiaceae bacterium]
MRKARHHGARAAADAAETALRSAMTDMTTEQAQQAGDRAMAELEEDL